MMQTKVYMAHYQEIRTNHPQSQRSWKAWSTWASGATKGRRERESFMEVGMRHGVWIQGELALPIQPGEGFLNKSAGNPRIYKLKQSKTRRLVMFGSNLHDWGLALKQPSLLRLDHTSLWNRTSQPESSDLKVGISGWNPRVKRKVTAGWSSWPFTNLPINKRIFKELLKTFGFRCWCFGCPPAIENPKQLTIRQQKLEVRKSFFLSLRRGKIKLRGFFCMQLVNLSNCRGLGLDKCQTLSAYHGCISFKHPWLRKFGRKYFGVSSTSWAGGARNPTRTLLTCGIIIALRLDPAKAGNPQNPSRKWKKSKFTLGQRSPVP